MKQITALCLAFVLIGSITSSPVWAWGGGGRFYGGGGYYGGPHYGGGGYYGRGRYGGGWGYGRGGGYGRSSFGFYFGAPLYPYPYYSYPYYYPPTVITVPVTPPVYIQQSPPAAQQNPSGYWYYCNNPEGYYPYIKDCPNGWQQVEPAPSAPSAPR